MFTQFPYSEEVNLSGFLKIYHFRNSFYFVIVHYFSNAPFAENKEKLRVIYFQDCAAVLMV